jgi:preprotein translocase subunit SecG
LPVFLIPDFPMSGFLLAFFVFGLILLCLFLLLLILMQRGGQQAGMGSAFGGGAAESAFGAEAGNILTKLTTWGVVVFFVLSLGLYLGFVAVNHGQLAEAQGAETELRALGGVDDDDVIVEEPLPSAEEVAPNYTDGLQDMVDSLEMRVEEPVGEAADLLPSESDPELSVDDLDAPAGLKLESTGPDAETVLEDEPTAR